MADAHAPITNYQLPMPHAQFKTIFRYRYRREILELLYLLTYS
jgi:hypothetical protein